MWPCIRSLALAALLATWPGAMVLGLHEMDHRYDLTGYILGDDRQPLSGVPVTAQLDGKTMGTGRSDSNGYFRFRLHLHDSDVGRELRIKTPDHAGTVRVTLTPGDTSTERIHHVNFVGGELVEGELQGRGGVATTAIAAGVGGVVLLGAIVAAGRLRRARRRRLRAERKAARRQGEQSKPHKRRKRGK